MNEANAKPKDFIRKLGAAEKGFLDLSDAKISLIASALFISSKLPILESHVTWACRRLMTSHPLLRMRIASLDGELWWREMEKLEPDVRVSEGGDWQEVYSQTADETYDNETGPLWRVTFLPEVTSEYQDEQLEHHVVLVLGFNHTIIDGTGITQHLYT